ncbi:helix-turn-helix domain-containing protein [Streptomyces sp. NPDC056194]|uniref:helix-turn-helix domain-containing protein n=1 Tax=unclassified Streptomyces TaxID=2593676 RepID=UPI0035E144DD
MGDTRLPPLVLSDAERLTLENWARRRSTAQGLAQRAQIVLARARGWNSTVVAARLGTERKTVARWRTRFCGTVWAVCRTSRGPGFPVLTTTRLSRKHPKFSGAASTQVRSRRSEAPHSLIHQVPSKHLAEGPSPAEAHDGRHSPVTHSSSMAIERSARPAPGSTCPPTKLRMRPRPSG